MFEVYGEAQAPLQSLSMGRSSRTCPALKPHGSHLTAHHSRARLCNISAETTAEDKEVSIYSRSCVMLESAGRVAALFFLLPCCCLVALLWQQGGLGRSLRLTASTEKFLAEGSCLNVRHSENALSYAGIPPRPIKPLGFNLSALSLLKYSSVPGARGGLQVAVPWVLGVL